LTDYGEKFMQLAHEAIGREEQELKELRSDRYADVASVWQFEEGWQQYVIVKHAIRKGIFPRLNAEFTCGKKRVDLCFVNDKGKVLAMFELKPGKPSPKIAEAIANDCDKLHQLATIHADAEKYVLGLLCASRSQIDDWEPILQQNLRASTATTQRLPALPDIPSNQGKVFRFVMLRVVTTASLKARA
jgi:hypothetical protein